MGHWRKKGMFQSEITNISTTTQMLTITIQKMFSLCKSTLSVS